MKPVLWIRFALACILALTGCTRTPQTLRVGINIWPGYEPLSIARDLRFYDGVNVEIVTLPSTAESLRAYRNGVIDIVALTADEAHYAAEHKTGQRIILVCDYSNGADRIMARPEYKSMADLRGRRIGAESSALGAFVLTRALEKSGLTPRDVTVVPVPLDEHEQAYASNQVDAIVTFEPHCSRLMASGALTVFDSTQIPGEIIDVLLTDSKTTADKSQAVSALIRGWFRALDYMKDHPAASARQAAQRQEISPENFSNALKGIGFPDREHNLRLLGSSPDSISGSLGRIHSLMLERGLITKTSQVQIELDDRFVPQNRP